MRTHLCVALSLLAGQISMSQNAGIGYPTPYGKLTIGHVVSPSSPTLALFEGIATGGPRIHFNNAGGSATWIQFANIDNGVSANSVLGFAYANEAFPVLTLRGNLRVGINQLSPGYTLDVNGDVNLTGVLRVNGTGGTGGQVLTSNGGSAPTWQDIVFTPPAGVGFSARLNGSVAIATGATVTLTSFVEFFDDGNNFNTATGVFTAPVAGMYQFHVQMNLQVSDLNNTSVIVRFLLNNVGFTGNQASVVFPQESSAVLSGVSHTINIKLNAGDAISVQVTQSSGESLMVNGSGGTSNSMFSGFKVY